MKKLTKVGMVCTLSLLALGLFFINKAEAQEGCGVIDYLNEEDVVIENCSNPFGLESIGGAQINVAGVLLSHNQTVIIEGEETDRYYPHNTPSSFSRERIFRHDPTGYVEVNSEYHQFTEEDYWVAGEAFFGSREAADQYVRMEIGEDVDTEAPTWDWDVYINFFDFYTALYKGWRSPLSVGTYTAVFYESAGSSMAPEGGFIDRIINWLVPTAYAQFFSEFPYTTVTFTIANPVEPQGASSVLFLPGIQASRLYKDGLFGTEDQLWEPNSDADVEDLRMSLSGQSLSSIYTKDVIDEVNVTPIGQGNIYKGFIESINELVLDEKITGFEKFAYDWRFSVYDVVEHGTQYENEVRNLIVAVEELAEYSYTGKVTLIGHSNGGLVAKALINELENQGKENLVDKVVFIGTPHLGTPKAIATILHGYDQQKLGGAIINDSTAREVMNNMPGAYGLLPSERYLSLADSTLISFEDSTSTQAQFQAFGAEVEGLNEYRNFLSGAEGRINDPLNISFPYRANTQMLLNALDLHNDLDNWEAPSPISVFNLVGTGLMTIDSILYREIVEMVTCTGNIFGQITCSEPDRFMRPYAKFSAYGDETVTALSAETVAGQTYYFDFKEYDENNITVLNPSHADLTELVQVQEFVLGIISSSTVSDSIPYISETKATYDDEYEITAIDSPVRIVKEDVEGNQTGVVIQNGNRVVVKQIPGSDYFEMGGTKYVIVPKEAGLNTSLYGEAFGSYTMTVATLRNGNNQTVDTELVNATTTPTMVATYELNQDGYTNILTDYNGDGTVDIETTLDGEVVTEELEITLETLRAQIISLNLKKGRELPLLVIIGLVEKTEKLKAKPVIVKHIHDKLLRQLSDTIKLYKKKGWISENQYDSLLNSINYLLNK